MPKQRDAGALRLAIGTSAFTPAIRDVAPLVELLGDDDETIARAAYEALVRAGSGAVSAVASRIVRNLDGASARSRAGAFRVLGRLAPSDRASAELLARALGDPDPQVQRSAARALGRLGASEAKDAIAAALVHAWDEAPELPLARALADAMGKLGLPEARARLEAVQDGDPELVRIARKAEAMVARDASRGETSEIRGDRHGGFDVDLVVSCRAGLEALVADELVERCPSARGISREDGGRVTAVWRGAPDDLFAVRTMLDFAFSVPAEPIHAPTTAEDACARALAGDTARRILETWTEGTVRYRLDWEGQGHRRGATWAVTRALSLDPRTSAWVNDPTNSTWNVSARVVDGALHLRLAPRKQVDPRFAYRRRDVPAASHPTIAAALVRVSRPGPDDVVWDPFVGSGSEIIERAKSGPYRALLGSDVDAGALDAARENLAAASVLGVDLSVADATQHAPSGVTRIITNPPMGRRVARDGSLMDLLDRFTDHAARVLVAGGRLAWLSPAGGRTAARAEASGLRVVLRQPVDMGGFHAELQVWDKLRDSP